MPIPLACEELDDSGLIEAAPDVFLAIADVATLLGIKRLDRNLGNLGGELAALSEILDSSLPEDRFERRIRKLLKELARACTWHLNTPREDFTFLFDLATAGQRKREAAAEAGLLAYASRGRLPKLIALLRGFSSGITQPQQPALDHGRPFKAISQNEYPKHVSQQLYQTLCKYSKCRCVEDVSNKAEDALQKKRHLSRLRLRPSRDVKERSICFDMVFSSRPVFPSSLTRIEWQHMQFQVSSERLGKKRARFSGQEKALDHLEQRTASATEAQLCQHITAASGSQICLRVHKDQLWLLEDCLPLESHILARPSLSLSDALQIGHLSNKMKVILAYILARSVWEFYDSDWMSRLWSAEDIHFLQEPSGDFGDEPTVSINRPYLAVEWKEDDNQEGDASTIVGQIHRYPRILSLGLLLIEVGTGKRAGDLFQNYQVNVNSDWLSAREFLAKTSPWDDFDYGRYWDAVRNCVNNQFFLRGAASSISGHALADIESRRRMIFEDVVTPLEDLLAGTGWIHDIWKVGPLKQSSTRNNAIQGSRNAISAPQPQAMLESTFRSLVISQPATQLRPRNRLEFEIAIICALPTEANAVISLFDENWDGGGQRYGKATRDPNAYTTGRLGHHNVVVVHMPGMGKVSAANVAQGLHSSFENIQLALVVGICGGVPHTWRHKQEIFLGDVVVSRSLIQYDFGRQYPTAFEAKDCLQGGTGKPPVEIRSILAKLDTAHHRHRLELSTAQFLKGLQCRLKGSAYPGPEKDKLFEPTSLHQHHIPGECHKCRSEGSARICSEAPESSCEELGCETSGVVRRIRPANPTIPEVSMKGEPYSPSIHIGNMGSGDTVMKSGTHRDEVSQKYDIIGFEMEGAGIWDFFPSLVIKAVCDYADSHKNKEWQNYAAATAAAATKAFLKEWRSEGGSTVE